MTAVGPQRFELKHQLQELPDADCVGGTLAVSQALQLLAASQRVYGGGSLAERGAPG
jgi:hypothetical protein